MSNLSGYKKYLQNTSWLFAEKVFRIIIVLFVTIWMARYLGPEQFGLFNYALSFVSLFAVFSTLGLDKLINKELLNHPSESNYILGTSFFLRLSGALLLIIISNFLITQIRPNNTEILLLVFVFSLTFLFKTLEIIKYWFESHVQAKYSAIIEAITIAISVLIKITLILNNAPLMAFAWTVLAESVLLALGLLLIYRIKLNKISAWRIQKDKIVYLLKEAWPLILAGTLYTIYTRIDQIMLGEMVGDQSVGIYAAAVKISEGWMFIPIVIATSFFPSMLNARKNDYSEYIKRTQHLLNIMALMGVIVGIAISLFAAPFISFAFGSNYTESSTVLIIHIWGGIFTAMSTVAYRYFIAEGLQKSSFYRGLIGLIVNIIFNYFLIPLYGAIGAAIATVISQAMALYIFNFTNTKTRPMFLMQTKALFLYESISTLKHIKSLRGNS